MTRPRFASNFTVAEASGSAIFGHGIGTAVLVGVAVLRLGLVRALILRVEDAVAVVVGIGTAVLVLEVIEVLGLVRALVAIADDAIAIGVGLGTAVGILDAVHGLGLVRALVEAIGDPVAVAVLVVRDGAEAAAASTGFGSGLRRGGAERGSRRRSDPRRSASSSIARRHQALADIEAQRPRSR